MGRRSKHSSRYSMECRRCPASTPAALAAKAATTTIPIVFGVGDDPVKLGLVASLSRPDSNATGINFFSAELTKKRLGILRELLPRTARIGVLVNPSNVESAERTVKDVKAAAPEIGLQVQLLNASNGDEIDAAFAALVNERADALLMAPDAFFNSRRVQLRSSRPATWFPRYIRYVTIPRLVV